MSQHQSDGGTSSATASNASVSLLDKYANLHSDMDQARKESSQHQSEMIRVQNEIQDLLDSRQTMTQATKQSKREHDGLEAQVGETTQQLVALEEEFSHAESRRAHAHTVQAMTQRRSDEYRHDFLQSTRGFRSACQDVLRQAHKRRRASVSTTKKKTGNPDGSDASMPLTDSREMDPASTTRESSTATNSERRRQQAAAASRPRTSTPGVPAAGDDEEDGDPSSSLNGEAGAMDIDSETDRTAAAQVNLLHSCSSNHILKTDWVSLIANVLPPAPGEADDVLARSEAAAADNDDDDVMQEDCTEQDQRPTGASHEEVHTTSTTTREDPDTPVENDVPAASDLDSTANAVGISNSGENDTEDRRDPRQDEDSLLPKDGDPSAGAANTEADLDSLFAQILQEIETTETAKDSEWQEAKQGLVLAESAHEHALQARDEIQEKHQKWTITVNHHRKQIRQLQNQNERVGGQVKALQEQHVQVTLAARMAAARAAAVGDSSDRSIDSDARGQERRSKKKQRLPSSSQVSLQSSSAAPGLATGDNAHPQRSCHSTARRNGRESTGSAGQSHHHQETSVHNPYLRQKSNKKRSPPLRGPAASSDNSNMSNAFGSRQQERGDDSRRRAVVSPTRDYHATHRDVINTGKSNSNLGTNREYGAYQPQHPHRVGRVRGGRGFGGISLSLEGSSSTPSSSSLQRNRDNDSFSHHRASSVASSKPRTNIANHHEEQHFRGSNSSVPGNRQYQHQGVGSHQQPSQTPARANSTYSSGRANVVSTTKQHETAVSRRTPHSPTMARCPPPSTPFADEYEDEDDSTDDDGEEMPGFAFRK